MKRNVDILKTAKGVAKHRWTEADLDKLREMWGKMPAAMIAERIAPTLTKSAVLGKAHYLDLPRMSEMQGGIRGGTPANRKKESALRQAHRDVPKHMWPSGRSSVPKLEEVVVRKPLPPAGRARTCQWPIGDPGTEGFRFCGSREVVPGRPYCAEHMIKAYLPSDDPAYKGKK